MPKTKKDEVAVLNSYIQEFGTNILCIDEGRLRCLLCAKIVTHTKRFSITSHLHSKRHIELLNKIDEGQISVLLLLTNLIIIFCST